MEPRDVAIETISKASDVLQKSDDIRMADMDISDDGERELFSCLKLKPFFSFS